MMESETEMETVTECEWVIVDFNGHKRTVWAVEGRRVKTDMMCDGLRLTILGCFRYSLGRITYMPRHTVDLIKQHYAIFTNQDWELFIKEIDECKDLGMECDAKTWNELKEFSIEQLRCYI